MLNIKKVAVTGGLAAGKTTVCLFLKEFGATVVSADEITHKLLSQGTTTGQRVVRLLGSDIINGSTLDRKKIASTVFSQPQLLEALEQIIHPAVFDEIEAKYQEARQDPKCPLFVAEVPLLYESGQQGRFDAIIAVASSDELSRKRFLSTPPHTTLEFEKRMTRQMPSSEKTTLATYTVANNGNLEELKAQTRQLYARLTQQ